ncbi:MAG: hypothetical protein ACLSEY_01700 [Enterocloster sp.]
MAEDIRHTFGNKETYEPMLFNLNWMEQRAEQHGFRYTRILKSSMEMKAAICPYESENHRIGKQGN